jgi:hypothetical protein
MQNAHVQRGSATHLSYPPKTELCPVPLELPVTATSDRERRIAIEVLAAGVVDVVVVAADEGGDHRADRRRPVAERLAGEHRRKLHSAGSVIGPVVASGAQRDCLVAGGHHR